MLLKSVYEYTAIYMAAGVTDLRKSVDGLANIVRQDFGMNPFGNYLFLFCNRSRNRLKGLTWDKNGFSLCYKRLDGQGARFSWPSAEPCVLQSDVKGGVTDARKLVRDIKVPQLKLLLDGFSIDPPKGLGEVFARDF